MYIASKQEEEPFGAMKEGVVGVASLRFVLLLELKDLQVSVHQLSRFVVFIWLLLWFDRSMLKSPPRIIEGKLLRRLARVEIIDFRRLVNVDLLYPDGGI